MWSLYMIDSWWTHDSKLNELSEKIKNKKFKLCIGFLIILWTIRIQLAASIQVFKKTECLVCPVFM